MLIGLVREVGAARMLEQDANAPLVRAQLYQMSPFDPVITLGAASGIAIVAVLSAWLPRAELLPSIPWPLCAVTDFVSPRVEPVSLDSRLLGFPMSRTGRSAHREA